MNYDTCVESRISILFIDGKRWVGEKGTNRCSSHGASKANMK